MKQLGSCSTALLTSSKSILTVSLTRKRDMLETAIVQTILSIPWKQYDVTAFLMCQNCFSLGLSLHEPFNVILLVVQPPALHWRRVFFKLTCSHYLLLVRSTSTFTQSCVNSLMWSKRPGLFTSNVTIALNDAEKLELRTHRFPSEANSDPSRKFCYGRFLSSFHTYGSESWDPWRPYSMFQKRGTSRQTFIWRQSGVLQ